MPVDRLSVTVPANLGAALRKLARQRRETVSQIVNEAIAHRLRMAALDEYLAETERQFGPLPAELIAETEAELRVKQPARRTRRR